MRSGPYLGAAGSRIMAVESCILRADRRTRNDLNLPLALSSLGLAQGNSAAVPYEFRPHCERLCQVIACYILMLGMIEQMQ